MIDGCPAEPTSPRQLSERDCQMLALLTSSDHPVVRSFPHGALIVFDHDLRYLSAGGLGLADVGLSREALEGKTIYEALPADTAAFIEPLYRAALAGESTTFDVPYANHMFTQRLSPIFGESGAIIAGMGFTQDVTETRLGEQHLRESEQRFRLAFEHAPIGVAVVGLDGLFREVNPALCRLTGYSADRLRELTFQDLTHPDDLDADLTQRAQLLTGDIESYEMQKRHYTASGALLWVLLTVSLVLADDGEPLYYVSQVQDITDRRMSAEASERVFRGAFEDALVGMCLTSLDGRFLVVNPVFEELLGRRSADLVGRPSAEFTHPDDVTANLDGFQRTLDGAIPGFKTSTRYLRPDGSVVHAELSTSLVRSEDGSPQYFSTQTVDMTARWVAQRERDTRDLMLRGVIANSQSLVYVKDLDGRYLLANEPFEKAFGVKEADLLGKDDTFLDPELAPIWRVNDLRAQHEEFHVPEWADGPDGRCYYESVKFPLRDPDGVVYATCGISLDVTKSRQAAEALELARDAALAATQAKSAFLATMSHEIRTPMNAVIGLTELLLDTELDVRQRGFAETIRSSGDALLTVINNILDFSSLEAHGIVLESVPFSLRSCIEEAVALVAPAAGDLELVSYVQEQCPDVLVGDPHRLRQVLINLLSNAVKFTEVGDVLLTVAPDDAPEASGDGASSTHAALSISVRDTGIGISRDGLARLFQSFSQVDASTTRLYGGTGLGLAISKGLVEAMGGAVSVTSTPGVGSTFKVDLVLPIGDDRTALNPIPAVQGLPGVRVLVVDDNDTSRQVLRVQLEDAGADVVTAGTGTDALATLDGSSFDVVVLDGHLPDMDGEELAARVRSMPTTAAVPLILLTSLATPPPDSDLFDVHHCKPVRAAALRVAIAEVLQRGRLTLETTTSGAWTEEAPGVVVEPLRVLLAEDNLVNQGVGVAMLTRLGHLVDVAHNGREALDSVERGSYDVVLMDIHMPVMDGLETTSAIRARLPGDRQPYVIALTASRLEQDRKACADAGMDAFLLKPVRLGALAEALAAAGPPASVQTRPGSVPSPRSAYDDVHARLDDILGADSAEPTRQMLIDMLLQQTPEQLDGLDGAIGRGDRRDVSARAHALKGMAGNLGAVALAKLSSEVEVRVGLGDLAGTAALLEQMRHEHEVLRQALT